MPRAALLRLLLVLVALGIGHVSVRAAERFAIPFRAFTLHASIEGRDVAIPVSGTATAEDLGTALDIRADIVADLADFRAQLGPIVRAKMNRDDDCDAKLRVDTVEFLAEPPVATLVATAHYEKWACFLGAKTRLFEQNGEVQVTVTPEVNDDAIAVRFAVTRVDADGVLGELLRTSIFGPWITEQIEQAFPKSLTVGRLRSALPPALKDVPATLSDVSMQDGGAGTPAIRGTLRLTIAADQLLAMRDALQK